MHRSFLSIFFLFLAISLVDGQNNTTHYSTKSKKVKREHYKNIKGSPFLFDDWVSADLKHLKEEDLSDVSIRYDLFEGNIEIKSGSGYAISGKDQEVDGERFFLLEDKYFKTIEIAKAKNEEALKDFDVDTIYLIKGIHRDYLRKYAVALYNGKDVKLIKTYEVKMRKNQINTPGKIEEIKKFGKSTGYALVRKKEKTKVKLKDKDFYKALGKESELKAFKKEHNLKMKKEYDFVKLLRYYESLEG